MIKNANGMGRICVQRGLDDGARIKSGGHNPHVLCSHLSTLEDCRLKTRFRAARWLEWCHVTLMKLCDSNCPNFVMHLPSFIQESYVITIFRSKTRKTPIALE